MRVAVSAGVRHVLRDVPDEGGEFASDGDADLALVHATGVQTPVATAEAQLCAPGEVGDGLELILVAHNVGEGHARRVAIAPGRLDQHAPHEGEESADQRVLRTVPPGLLSAHRRGHFRAISARA